MTPRLQAEQSIDSEIDLPAGRVQSMVVHHPGPNEIDFFRPGVFWMDLCLTPRRPQASARYVDRWGPHRSSDLGSLIALPPGEHLHLRNAGGKHASVVLQLRVEAVRKWLPEDFAWTDRRLEACLHIASDKLRTLMLWLYHEIGRPDRSAELCEAIVTHISAELARYILSVNEPTEKGGLSSWRLRTIDNRLSEPGKLPTLQELASLCKLSVRQLTRGFRASRGCSISAYLAQLRIDEAKRRLCTRASIKEVAASLGYASQSAFTFSFRKATGITPNHYRKSQGSAPRSQGASVE